MIKLFQTDKETFTMASLDLGMKLVGSPQGEKQKTDELLEIFFGMYKKFSDAAKSNKKFKANYPL
jgi:hypothetical protein